MGVSLCQRNVRTPKPWFSWALVVQIVLPVWDACARYAPKRVKKGEDMCVTDQAFSLQVQTCYLTLRKTLPTVWKGRIFITFPICSTVTGIRIIPWVAGFWNSSI